MTTWQELKVQLNPQVAEQIEAAVELLFTDRAAADAMFRRILPSIPSTDYSLMVWTNNDPVGNACRHSFGARGTWASTEEGGSPQVRSGMTSGPLKGRKLG